MPVVLSRGPARRMRTRGLLLDAIDEFDATVSTQGSERANPYRWLDGVRFQPFPCTASNILNLDPCAGGVGSVVGAACQEYVLQRPFQIVDALIGSPLQLAVSDLDNLLVEREQELRSWAFAKSLIGPVVTSGQHTLAVDATAPSGLAFGSAPTPLTNAFAVLETELASRLHGVQGIIHLPPGMTHQAVYKGGLIAAGSHWETPNGNKVVTDSGYISPSAPTGQSAAAAGTDWIYATGPVEYKYGGPGMIGDGDFENSDTAHNKLERFMQEMGILIYDPCPVTAVLAAYETA